MGAKNKVIAGDYEGKIVMVARGNMFIATSATNPVMLSGSNILDYHVVDSDSRKSASSAVARGLAGNFLIGPVGLLAAASAKNKDTHVIAIEFRDGKRSLLELDGKLYKALISAVYTYKPTSKGNYNPNIKAGKYAPVLGEKSDTAKLFGKIGKGFMIFLAVGLVISIISVLVSPTGNDPIYSSNMHYDVLGDKSLNGLEGKCYRAGIEMPEEFNAEDITRYFIEQYKDKDIEEVIVYIYEKGYQLEDTVEMNRDAIYELTIEKSEAGYSYLLWNVAEDSEVESGVIE